MAIEVRVERKDEQKLLSLCQKKADAQEIDGDDEDVVYFLTNVDDEDDFCNLLDTINSARYDTI